MSIRAPDSSIEIPAIDNLEPVLTWHTLKCELVTPMYGGGVKSTVVDEKMPIRAASIRGQLRAWWRLLAKHKWQLGDGEAIRKAEFAIWGGMGSGDTDGVAGQVFLRVGNCKGFKVEPWAEYKPNRRGRDTLYPKDWANVPYALFPAQGRTEKNPQEEPHSLLREGFKWDLKVAFDSKLLEESQEQVWEAIRWWSNFGGVGSRTRRGLGAFKIEKNINFDSVVNIEEIHSLGFDAKIKHSNSAYKAWEYAVNSLSKFRQIGEGRNDYSSRSHWPEPDAIRHHTGQSLPSHSIRKTEGNIFPRAAFGLPIIFKFKDGGAGRNSDPDTTTLKVVHDDSKIKLERMSSPLILRPYFDGISWHTMALVLPYTLEAALKENEQIKLKLDEEEVEFWDARYIDEIKPIKDNGGQDPMQAFLTYFAK